MVGKVFAVLVALALAAMSVSLAWTAFEVHANAKSVLHQIYGILNVMGAVVCWAAVAIVSAILGGSGAGKGETSTPPKAEGCRPMSNRGKGD